MKYDLQMPRTPKDTFWRTKVGLKGKLKEHLIRAGGGPQKTGRRPKKDLMIN